MHLGLTTRNETDRISISLYPETLTVYLSQVHRQLDREILEVYYLSPSLALSEIYDLVISVSHNKHTGEVKFWINNFPVEIDQHTVNRFAPFIGKELYPYT